MNASESGLLILVVQTPNDRHRSIVLPPSGAWTVGRAPSCDVCIDDASASIDHAEIRWENGRVQVRDRASRFGTFLGDTQLDQSWRPWTPGVSLWIGETECRLRPAEMHGDEATVALDAGLASAVVPREDPAAADASDEVSPETSAVRVPTVPGDTRSPTDTPASAGRAPASRLRQAALVTALTALAAVLALWAWLLSPPST